MKLKSVDQPKIFYQVAHRLILLQQGPFTFESLVKQYYKKCGSNISLEYVKKVLQYQLDELSKNGWITTSQDKSETYYSIYIEDEKNKDNFNEKIKEELSKDESWIIMY